MARRVWCALTACAVLAIGQHATAQSLGQAAAAARKAPAVDRAVRADIEKLMVITGSVNLGVQLASQMSDAVLKGFAQASKDAVPPRAIEIVKEVLNAEFATAFNGPEIKGEISAGGERDRYTFTVETAGQYSIQTSGNTDTFVSLFGPNSESRLIAEDDDSGPGNLSLLTQNLTPGRYFVKVRLFSASSTGPYGVSVRKS